MHRDNKFGSRHSKIKTESSFKSDFIGKNLGLGKKVKREKK